MRYRESSKRLEPSSSPDVQFLGTVSPGKTEKNVTEETVSRRRTSGSERVGKRLEVVRAPDSAVPLLHSPRRLSVSQTSQLSKTSPRRLSDALSHRPRRRSLSPPVPSSQVPGARLAHSSSDLSSANAMALPATPWAKQGGADQRVSAVMGIEKSRVLEPPPHPLSLVEPSPKSLSLPPFPAGTSAAVQEKFFPPSVNVDVSRKVEDKRGDETEMPPIERLQRLLHFLDGTTQRPPGEGTKDPGREEVAAPHHLWDEERSPEGSEEAWILHSKMTNAALERIFSRAKAEAEVQQLTRISKLAKLRVSLFTVSSRLLTLKGKAQKLKELYSGRQAEEFDLLHNLRASLSAEGGTTLSLSDEGFDWRLD